MYPLHTLCLPKALLSRSNFLILKCWFLRKTRRPSYRKNVAMTPFLLSFHLTSSIIQKEQTVAVLNWHVDDLKCSQTKLQVLNSSISVQIFLTSHCLSLIYSGRRGGLMVSELDSGSSSLSSSPGWGHCVVFLDKTLYSHSASLHSVYKWVPANLMPG